MDRGSFSLEVILTLMAFKVLYPRHMHLARGNHESQSMNKVYGFDGEVALRHAPVMCTHRPVCTVLLRGLLPDCARHHSPPDCPSWEAKRSRDGPRAGRP